MQRKAVARHDWPVPGQPGRPEQFVSAPSGSLSRSSTGDEYTCGAPSEAHTKPHLAPSQVFSQPHTPWVPWPLPPPPQPGPPTLSYPLPRMCSPTPRIPLQMQPAVRDETPPAWRAGSTRCGCATCMPVLPAACHMCNTGLRAGANAGAPFSLYSDRTRQAPAHQPTAGPQQSLRPPHPLTPPHSTQPRGVRRRPPPTHMGPSIVSSYSTMSRSPVQSKLASHTVCTVLNLHLHQLYPPLPQDAVAPAHRSSS